MKSFNQYVEAKQTCGDGQYYCFDENKCKDIPEGMKVGKGGMLVNEIAKKHPKIEENPYSIKNKLKMVGTSVKDRVRQKYNRFMGEEEVKMSRKEYAKIHKDFKSDDPKNPRTTRYVKGKGTVSSPVKFTDEYNPEGEDLKEYSPNISYQAKGGKKSGKLGKSSVYSLRDKDESKKDFRKSHVKDIKDGMLKHQKEETAKLVETPKFEIGKSDEQKSKRRNLRTFGKGAFKKGDPTSLHSTEADDIRSMDHEDNRGVKKKKGVKEDWQRKSGKSESGGLNEKGRKSYEAQNPGSDLKAPVTGKVKKGGKAAGRRKSFCSRMRGMKKKLTSAKTARDPDSRINKALRKWKC